LKKITHNYRQCSNNAVGKINLLNFFAVPIKIPYKLLLSFTSVLHVLSYFFTAHFTPNFSPLFFPFQSVVHRFLIKKVPCPSALHLFHSSLTHSLYRTYLRPSFLRSSHTNERRHLSHTEFCGVVLRMWQL
jgi:hypothetical protein